MTLPVNNQALLRAIHRLSEAIGALERAINHATALGINVEHEASPGALRIYADGAFQSIRVPQRKPPVSTGEPMAQGGEIVRIPPGAPLLPHDIVITNGSGRCHSCEMPGPVIFCLECREAICARCQQEGGPPLDLRYCGPDCEGDAYERAEQHRKPR